jgi:NAD(P)-dependent dehydrogenase (short-subunit alcohol dehydrogenase family)
MTRVFVIGGAGALGSAFISEAKTRGFETVCIDYRVNQAADHNISPPPTTLDLGLPLTDDRHQHNIVVCTAGSWSGGSLKEYKREEVEKLIASNLVSTLWSAGLAHSLPPSTTLILTSAHASLAPAGTPSMSAYGAVKSAVNHVAQTAAGSGLGVVLLLPRVLDTAENRRVMGVEGVAGWTPCAVVAQYALDQASASTSGGLVRVSISTDNHQTSFTVV